MMAPDDNGWDEWQNHVLAELKRLSGSVDKLNETVHQHREKTSAEIAALKVKSHVWGIVGGAIPMVLALCWYLIYILIR